MKFFEIIGVHVFSVFSIDIICIKTLIVVIVLLTYCRTGKKICNRTVVKGR